MPRNLFIKGHAEGTEEKKEVTQQKSFWCEQSLLGCEKIKCSEKLHSNSNHRFVLGFSNDPRLSGGGSNLIKTAPHIHPGKIAVKV